MTAVVEHMGVATKVTGEVMSLGLIVGTVLEYLPAAAALVAIIWHCCLLYDWATKKVRGKRKGDKKKKS